MGLRRCGTPPYGYERTENREIVQNAHEQAIIAEIIERHGAGESNQSIADDMRRRKIPTKKNGRWYANTIREIIMWRDFYLRKFG
jgi:hypothetical protein